MKKGISLMELVASMCIIAALATAVTPVVSNLVEQSRFTHALQDISTLQDQLNSFGDSLNRADALLRQGGGTLFASIDQAITEGAIPESLLNQFGVGDITLVQDEVQALNNAGILQIAYRPDPLASGIDERLQWVSEPLSITTPLLRVDMETDAVKELIRQKFVGIDLDAIDADPLHPNHVATLVVVGIGPESDLVKKLGQLPTDLNAGSPDFYDRYLAVVWVGTREKDITGTPTPQQVNPLQQAKVLGVVDSQLRTKSELANLILCP